MQYQNVGNAIAKQIRSSEVKGNLLPEDKVNAIKILLQQSGKIVMTVDGVNDVSAMTLSTVNIVMGVLVVISL